MRTTRWKSRWGRWGAGAGLLGLVLFGPGLYDLLRMSIMRRRLDRQLAALSVEQERLKREQERLQSDPAYVEGLIRSTFKLAQPGEYVILINDALSSGRKSLPKAQ